MSLDKWKSFAPPPRKVVSPDKWNVFLSYRSINRTWVLNLYDVLRQHDYQVFLDQCVLKPGDELILELQDALKNSQAGILIWSSKTGESDWVLREYQSMERRVDTKPGFVFVPLALDDSELPDFAANRIYVNFSSYPDGPNGGELLRLLYALVEQPLSPEAARFANQQDVASKSAINKINAAIDIGDPEYLVELFEGGFNEEGDLAWKTSSALGCKAVEGLIELGQKEKAMELLGKLRQQFPNAIRPKQLHALTLARAGDVMKAQRILAELYAEGERDPETLGIYGRTWMDRYQKSKDINHLIKSRDLYAEAFEGAKDDYYTGINAAAKSVLVGEPEDIAKAAKYAERVEQIVGTEPHPGDYWKTATVGETFLIQKKYEDAARLYKDAVAIAPAKTDSHLTTWTQACRLMEKLQPADEQRAAIRAVFKSLPDCEAILNEQ
ncbi:MAG TPA: TIR domain-containing protein [Pyrinomonadaceae bacterium]|jgi:hypothetical protein